nr:MAG TPA: hypothetical protein [Caudoviricetes sp.]
MGGNQKRLFERLVNSLQRRGAKKPLFFHRGIYS